MSTPAVYPSTFANQFFGFAGQFLNAQNAQMERQFSALQNVTVASQGIVNATAANTNLYFYGLAAQQTDYLNTLGTAYAKIAKDLAKKMPKPGVFGMLGF